LALRGGSETRILSQNEKDLGKKFPDELLLLGQFDFKPGSTAPAALVERIRPFRNQLRRTIISSVSERFSTFSTEVGGRPPGLDRAGAEEAHLDALESVVAGAGLPADRY
jgi:hypothetical protein